MPSSADRLEHELGPLVRHVVRRHPHDAGPSALLALPGLGVTVFVEAAARRRGHGDALVAELERGEEHVLAEAGSELERFLVARGFEVAGETRAEGRDLLQLRPPARREGAIIGASCALVHLESRSVLLGARLTEPRVGQLALPGGKVEPGELPELAAARELREETGIVVTAPIVGRTRVYAADRARLFRIDAFVRVVHERPEPAPSTELRAAWVDIDEAIGLDVTSGTRRVLRALAARWPRERAAAPLP